MILVLDLPNLQLMRSVQGLLPGPVRFGQQLSLPPTRLLEYSLVVASDWTDPEWIAQARNTEHLQDVLIMVYGECPCALARQILDKY